MGLERVFSEHEVKNSATGKVLNRLVMKCEGILCKNQMIKGALVDSAYHSILKEEYLNSEKKEQ